MTISLHDIDAWVGTKTIDIIDASITMDESWSPYVQASLKTVLNSNTLADLDPRNGGRIKVYVSQSYGASDKLSSLSTTYGGLTIAAVTTAWTGKTVADLSAWYFAPYNPSGSNKLSRLSSLYGGQTITQLTTAWTGLFLYQLSEMYFRSYPDGINNNFERGFDLTIRSRKVNVVDGTVELELASDEALLQDYALVSSLNYSPSSLQLRQIIKQVLARIGAYLAPGATDATVTASAALWAPGQDAWDYLISLVQQAKLRLYCDEQRMFHLVDDTFTQPGLAELWSVGTIKGTDDSIDLNADEWYDAVVIKYTWVNDAGATVNTYDTAYKPGYTKVKLFEFTTNYPGAGAAQRILNRAIARGRQLDVTTVSNYAVQPSMATDIYITGQPTEHVYIKAVSWNYPADEMTITTRQPVITS